MDLQAKFLVSHPDPASQKTWHGTNPFFSAAVGAFYQDNSIQKAVLLKEKLDFSVKQLSIKRKLLHLQTDIRNNAQDKRKLQEKWEEMIQSELNKCNEIEVLRNNSAIIIQKHVRGFLARVATEEDFISFYEKKSQVLIRESSLQALNIMLNLGVILVPATIALQKAYKRYQIRKKIVSLRQCYEIYLNDKLNLACEIIQKGFRMMVMASKLKFLKFLKHREERLVEIKEKLAILTIKEFWRSKKFSFKIIKEKIQRIKRRNAAMQNKEAFAKYLSAIGGKYEKRPNAKLSIGTEEDHRSGSDSALRGEDQNNDYIDEEDYLEAQRIKEMIQKKIQEKVNKSKVAHSITETKPVMVLPLMQEKALKESPSDDIGKLMHLTTSAFAKGRTISRQVRMPSRSTLIGSPPSYEHKKIFRGSPLPHMRAIFTPEPEIRAVSPQKNIDYAEFMANTVSSVKKQYKNQIKIKTKKEFINIPVSSNLIVPTVAFTMKQNQKRILQKQKNLSFTHNTDKYVPSLSNQSYTPIPWKPVPLHKNILIKTEYGKSMYKERNMYKYSTINFNNRMMTPDLPRLSKQYLPETPFSYRDDGDTNKND